MFLILLGSCFADPPGVGDRVNRAFCDLQLSVPSLQLVVAPDSLLEWDTAELIFRFWGGFDPPSLKESATSSGVAPLWVSEMVMPASRFDHESFGCRNRVARLQ